MSPAFIVKSKTLGLLSAGILTLSVSLGVPTSGAAGQGHQLPQAPIDQQPAQAPDETRPPAYIASLEGTARLDRDGQSEAAERGVPLVPGDRLRTDAGRIELAFPNGSQVYVDRYTELEFEDVLAMRLARGRVFVRLSATIDNAERLVIDAPGATVQFNEDGEYRIGVGGADAVEVEVAVLRGSASLASEAGNVIVPQGQHALVRDGASPTTPEWFNASQTTLERWAADREAMWQSGNYASRQYLPSELSSYASTFDRYGSWQNDDTYGEVWYPSSMSEDWRPYNDGRWDYTSSYGWTWIATGDAWAYPTHHYGRWNMGSRGWFWIPSRHWGSAWVYWAISPGYVGWCPLGWNGRPVINVFNYDRTYTSRWRDPYRAWSVIPRDSFGRSHPTYADRGRLGRERPAFVLQHVAPGYAPPRSPYPAAYSGGRTAGYARPFSGDRAPVRTPGRDPNGDRSPRSYGTYGSTNDDRGGHAAPRADDSTPASESPYERARPYMPRPSSRDDSSYRRVPSNQAPTRSPNGVYRPRDDRDDDNDKTDDNRRGGAGIARPGYRAPESPGMSRPSDSGGRRPGMSDPSPNDRRAVPRSDPPPRRDDGGSRDRAGDRNGDRSGDRGGNRNGDSHGSSSSSGSSGGAVRRHP